MATTKSLKKLSTPRFSWSRLLKRDYLLVALSISQFVLFVPLAWWAHKHPLSWVVTCLAVAGLAFHFNCTSS